MTPRNLPTLMAVSTCLAVPAFGQTVTFELLPQTFYAMDMSPDGRFIVGTSDQNEDGFPDGTYLLDTETDTLTLLPPEGLAANAVSDDGTVVLGDMTDPEDGVDVAGIWTQETGWQSLGWLPNAENCPSRSNGYQLSADGSVAVGLSWDGCDGRAFAWTAETGMQELGMLANGGNRASVISADGTIAAGFAQGTSSRTPAFWNVTGSQGALLDPPNGDVVGEVHGVSDDGTILLGNWDQDAFTYTTAGGLEIVGSGALSTAAVGIAVDVADNGTIVGYDTFFQNRTAWVKMPGDEDLTRLTRFVEDRGGIVPPGFPLQICTSISADGRTILGHSVPYSGWKITIEAASACPGDVDESGAVDFADVLALIASWGGDGAGADIAAPNDVVDFEDLLGLLANWGTCN